MGEIQEYQDKIQALEAQNHKHLVAMSFKVACEEDDADYDRAIVQINEVCLWYKELSKVRRIERLEDLREFIGSLANRRDSYLIRLGRNVPELKSRIQYQRNEVRHHISKIIDLIGDVLDEKPGAVDELAEETNLLFNKKFNQKLKAERDKEPETYWIVEAIHPLRMVNIRWKKIAQIIYRKLRDNPDRTDVEDSVFRKLRAKNFTKRHHYLRKTYTKNKYLVNVAGGPATL